MAAGFALTGRTSFLAFVLGSAAVTAGVCLHLPMLWMGRHHGFNMAGMAMDNGMLAGMALIVAGFGLAAFGLLPRAPVAASDAADIVVAAPEDARLTAAHWRLMLVLVVALIIDTRKPASLGFTIPGMIDGMECTLDGFAGAVRRVIGTVFGSVVWGMIADTYGRQARSCCPR